MDDKAERLARCIDAMRRNIGSMSLLILSLDDYKRTEEDKYLKDAAIAWYELGKDDKRALWVSKAEGGWLTEDHHKMMTSPEFKAAYYGQPE